jgi:hypothetical protein
MLRTLKNIEGCRVVATDGDIGTVVGFLLDEQRWVVRYFVVETGGFAGGRKLLISPISIRKGLLSHRVLQVGLTVDKVQYGPNPDLSEPITRQQERDYNRHYGYARYWGDAGPWGVGTHPSALALMRKDDVSADESAEETSEVHLRADADVRDYRVEACDGVIGRIADFVVDEDSWEVCYLVVDTEVWQSGPELLIPPAWATRTAYAHRTLKLDLSRQAVGSCPAWIPSRTIEREYEVRLHGHYQRRGYWEPRE